MITIDRASGLPIYLQIRHQLVYEIALGRLQAGAPLPSIRQLAANLRVTTVTVRHAYDALVGVAGNPFTKNGLGTLTITGTNTHAGGVTVNAGALEVKRLHAEAWTVNNGGTLRVLHSAPAGAGTHPERGDNAFVSQPSSLTINAGGTLDITNNDVIINYTGGASPAARSIVSVILFSPGLTVAFRSDVCGVMYLVSTLAGAMSVGSSPPADLRPTSMIVTTCSPSGAP